MSPKFTWKLNANKKILKKQNNNLPQLTLKIIISHHNKTQYSISREREANKYVEQNLEIGPIKIQMREVT